MLDRALLTLRARPWLFAALLSVALLAANIAAEPDFGDPGNWPRQLATLSPLVLVAFATMPSIVSGGLDLSVGPLAVFCNVLLVQELLTRGTDSAWVCVPVLLIVGMVVGAINGVLVAVLRYVPIIATVCMFFVLSGLTLQIGATSRAAGDNWTQSLGDQIGPIPGALVLMVVPVIVWLALSRTRYHRALYAVGGNDVTAFSAGVDVRATRIIAYALGGLFAAIAGLAITANVQSSQPSTITFYILAGLTAVALGGIPLLGGRGGMTGAFFGALSLYLIQTLLNASNVAPNWVNVVYGGMLLLSVLLGATVVLYRPRRRKGLLA